MTDRSSKNLTPSVEALNRVVCVGHEGYAEALHAVNDEIERLTRERDEWAEKWRRVRAELAELKYPGMKGVIRPLSGEPNSAPETSERCHFRAFGALPCEKPRGHADDHLCRWPAQIRDDWLPIETAPDPQVFPVLGAVPRGDAGDYAVGEMHQTEVGWYWAGNDPSDSWGGQIYPAYWQPLPEPPGSAVKACGEPI